MKTANRKPASTSVWVIASNGKQAWDWNSDKVVTFNDKFTADDFIKQGHNIGADDRKGGFCNVWN